MTEGFNLAFGVIVLGTVAEERVRIVGIDGVALLVLLAGLAAVWLSLYGRIDFHRLCQRTAEARNAGIAVLLEGCFIFVRQLVQLIVQCCVHHAVQNQRYTLIGLIILQREGILIGVTVLRRDCQRLRPRF